MSRASAEIASSRKTAQFFDRDAIGEFAGASGMQARLQDFLHAPDQDLDAYLSDIQELWDSIAAARQDGLRPSAGVWIRLWAPWTHNWPDHRRERLAAGCHHAVRVGERSARHTVPRGVTTRLTRAKKRLPDCIGMLVA